MRVPLILTVILVLLATSNSKHHHKCIHDEILKNFVPKTEPINDQRLLLEGIEDVKKPLRVTFDTSSLTDSVGTQVQRDFLKNDLLPLIAKYFETRLQIRRRTTPIKFPWDTCYQVKVPESHKTVGVDTDLLIYITAAASNQGFVAWATACMNDGVNGRPLFGQVNFNLNYLSTNPEDFEGSLGTALHEVAHVLGFSGHAITRFVNPDTGEVLPREQLIESTTLRGFKTTIVKTPKLVEVARKHFGCPTIRGVEMENQGGGGSLGSHFERTILMNEAMTASVINNQAFSKFTLALLEDSGWYYPNYDLADEFFFGQDSGCEFFERGCEASNQPREYCYDDQKGHCTIDFYGKGYCSGDGFADNCKYVAAYGEGDCRNPQNQGGDNNGVSGEKYGATSKCVLGTLLKDGYRPGTQDDPKCVEYRCSSGKVVLTIHNGKSATCNYDGERVTFAGYSGNLLCPSAKLFCETYYETCPNYCSGKGKCIDGKCWCRPGRTGVDCSQVSGCSNDCNGNGVCQASGECVCNSGWTGNACQTRTTSDPCSGINCGSNGVCRAGQCICNAGFTGRTCSEVVDPCKGINCGNGRCSQGKCICNSGWTGVTCNQQIIPPNPCEGKNCGNGVCKEGKCVCNNGWTGDNCSVRVDPCAGKNCGNGTCRNGVCNCNAGWTGPTCSVQVVDPCKNINCLNGGKCSNGVCICNTGYAGSRCETRTSSTPTVGCPRNCNNRGRCVNGKCFCNYPAYSSDCSLSYETGCPDSRCSGNGICFKSKCYCNAFFAGDSCQNPKQK